MCTLCLSPKPTWPELNSRRQQLLNPRWIRHWFGGIAVALCRRTHRHADQGLWPARGQSSTPKWGIPKPRAQRTPRRESPIPGQPATRPVRVWVPVPVMAMAMMIFPQCRSCFWRRCVAISCSFSPTTAQAWSTAQHWCGRSVQPVVRTWSCGSKKFVAADNVHLLWDFAAFPGFWF